MNKIIYYRIHFVVLRYKKLDSNTEIKKYSDEIPSEIKTLLKGLSSDDRLGILIALMKNGKMSFNEMKEKFGLHSSSLSNHLTALQDGNLIENFYEKRDEKGFSYYDVTDIPETVFDSLFNIMYNPVTEIEDHSTETEKAVETEMGSSPSKKKELEELRPINVRWYVQRPRLATSGSSDVESFDGAGSI